MPNEAEAELQRSATKYLHLQLQVREQEHCDEAITAKLKLKHEIGHLEAIMEPNTLDECDLNHNQNKLEVEQNKDANINSVKEWITKNSTPNLTYSNFELKKYNKQLSRRNTQNGILVREQST